MLADHFQRVPAERGEAPAVIAGDTVASYSDLDTRIRVLVERWRSLAGQRVGLAQLGPVEHVATVAALDALRCHVFLAGRGSPREIMELADRLQWNVIVGNLVDSPQIHTAPTVPADIDSHGEGIVTLLTSGTTGNPKAANHTWSTLASPVRRDPRYRRHRWMCAYPLNLYAGTQVMLQALLNWSALVMPSSLDPTAVARTMRESAVTHASGTPTFWRRLLLFGPPDELGACRLEQITMGGEAVTQGLLDQLSRLFPQTRLVHIYASTELGRLFSVTDQREGFPAEWLDRPPEDGIDLRIIDGELMACSHNAMLGYDRQATGNSDQSTVVTPDKWVATGDLVERHGDRVLFRGRKTEVINVGGQKVMPSIVETVLREATGVGDVRVYGKGSSLVGQLVAADIVLARGSDERAVRGEIDRIASGRLARHEVPRFLRVVESIAHNGAMKIVRSEAE